MKRIEKTIAELNRHMQNLNSHKLTVNSYRTNLFDTDIQIRIWKANELSFYDQLLKKYSEMGVEIEKKVSQMNVLGNNLKRKFSASNVLSEEEKRKKRRKIQNQIKSQTDKEKRNIASLLNLIKEITPEKLTSSIQDTIHNSSNTTDLPFKITSNEITMFKENTQLLPRFHLEPIRSLIDKKTV